MGAVSDGEMWLIIRVGGTTVAQLSVPSVGAGKVPYHLARVGPEVRCSGPWLAEGCWLLL